MVEEGSVGRQDKRGNDKADEGAERGATKAKGYVAELAKYYSKRNEAYAKFMQRVQHFIHLMMVHMREASKEAKKGKNPLAALDKDFEKTEIRKELKYADGAVTMQIPLTHVAPHTSKDWLEWGYTAKARNFLTNVRWMEEERADTGGVTWLELFVLYCLHGGKGKDQGKEGLVDKTTLQTELKDFKAAVRRVAMHCCSEDQEWCFATTYSRQNRLKELAICNKHAGFRRMPYVEKETATVVVKCILDMKGATTRKHKNAHEKGALRLKAKPLTYRGGQAWEKRLHILNDWVSNPVEPMGKAATQKSTSLEIVKCPSCSRGQDVRNSKLFVNSAISNIKRKHCGDTSSARKWACTCGTLWFKRGTHVHRRGEASGPLVCQTRKVKRHNVSGTDKPPPKCRKTEQVCSVFELGSDTQPRVRLRQGSKLAAKFPYLVQT